MDTSNTTKVITGVVEPSPATGYVLYTACRDCGATFGMPEDEIIWYRDHGYVLPKGCPDCRKARRKERVELRKRKKEKEEVGA